MSDNSELVPLAQSVSLQGYLATPAGTDIGILNGPRSICAGRGITTGLVAVYRPK